MNWTLASRFRTLASLAALGGLSLVLPSSASSQERPLVTPDDYGRWERLGGVEVSPLGDWIAYEVTRVDETSELRVRRIEEDSVRGSFRGDRSRGSPRMGAGWPGPSGCRRRNGSGWRRATSPSARRPR